jgi:hypothetical protein
MFVSAFRKTVVDLVRSKGSVPTYGYLPDDVAHLPCHVVGRPTITESGTPALMTLNLDVTLLGRRISDDDSQAELDALADELFDLLGGTRSVKTNDTHLRCVQLLPATVIVAGNEMPAYIASVSMDALSC